MRARSQHKAHLVSIVGIAGIGKSRLAWEFQKYLDGVAQTTHGIEGGASRTERASRSGRWPRW